MSPDPFDDLDRALQGGLGALADAEQVGDADSLLTQLRPALRRARRRRRAARVSGAVVALALVVGAAAAVAAAGSDHRRVSVASPTTTTNDHPNRGVVGSSSTSTTTAPSPPSTVRQPRGGPPATVSSGVAVPDAHDNPVPNGPSPTTTVAAANHTYRAFGGQLTIRFAAGRLSLVSYDANRGWYADLHDNRSDKIEVRFYNGPRQSYIRVEIDHGRLVETDR